MANENNLNILINAELNTGKSIGNINTQIKAIQKKIDKLNLKFEIDKNTINTLNSFAKALDKFKIMQEIQNKVIEENERIVKKADGSIEKFTEQILANGEIIRKNRTTMQERTKSIEEQTVALENLGKLQKKVTQQDADLNVLGTTEKYKNTLNNLQTTVKYDADSKMTKVTVVDDIERLNKEIEKAQKIGLDNLVEKFQRQQKEIKTLVGNFDELKKKNIEANDVAKVLSRQYGDLEIREKSLDILTGKYTVTLKKSSKENLVLKGSIDQTTGALYRQSEAIKMASAKNLGFFEQFKIATSRIPVWMAGMSAFYFPLRQTQQGIKYVLEIDKELTNLQKVADGTRETFKEFALEANQLGMDLGKTTAEVIRSTSEFARLGYNLKQAKQLAQESLLYSNVGDIDIADASQNLISAIKGFGIEVDTQGKNVRKIVDLYNEIGNNYAISSAGIGEAARRSAASLHEAGNSIEQSVAMITAANSVIQDPAQVGTALKTVSMRLRGIEEDGTDVVNLVPQLEQSFNNIGLSIKKNDDTFKSTFEIFDDLAKVWDKLSDFERANITELVAGKRQGNIVAAMLGDWETSLSAYEDGLKSAGSSTKEFEKYQESAEYKIKKFQNTLVGFWQQNLNSDSIKSFVDASTDLLVSMTKLTDVFGLMAPVVFVVSSAFIGLSKNGEIFRKWTMDVIPSLGNLNNRLKASSESNIALGKAFNFAKIQAFALQSALSIGLGAAIALISFGVQKLIEKHQKLKKEQEENEEQQKKLVESWTDNNKEIKENITLYEKLGKAIKDGSANEKDVQAYINVQNKLNELLPNLTERIDQNGNAHLKNSNAIKEEITYVEGLKKAYNNLEIEQFQKNVEDHFEKIKDLNNEIGFNKIKVDEYAKWDSSSSLKLYQEEIKQIEVDQIQNQRELSLLYKQNEEYVKNRVNQYLELDNSIQNLTKSDQEYLNANIEKQKSLYKDYESVEEKANQIADVGKKISGVRASLGELTESMSMEQILKIANTGFTQAFGEIAKSLEKGTDDWKRYTLEIYNSKIAGEEIDAILNIIRDSIGRLDGEIQTQLLTNQQLQESIKGASDSLSLLNSAQQEMQNEGELSSETILQMVDKYADFIDIVGDGESAILDFINTKRVESVEFINEEKKKTDGLIEQAKKRLEVADKEYKAYDEYLKLYRKSIEASIIAKQSAGIIDDVEADKLIYNLDRNLNSKKNNVDYWIAEIEKYENKMQGLTKLEGVLLNPSSSNSKSSTSSNSKEEYLSNLDIRYRKLEETIAQLNSIIDTNDKKLSMAETESDKKAILNEQIVLYQKMQEGLHALNQERRKERDEVAKSLRGLGFNVVIENDQAYIKNLGIIKSLTGDNAKQADELTQKLWDLDGAIDSTGQQWYDYKTSIQSAEKEMLDIKKEIANDTIDIMKAAIEKQRDLELAVYDQKLKKLEETHEAEMEMLDDKLDKYEEIINAKQKEIDLEAEKEDYQKRLTNAQKEAQDIQNKINILTLAANSGDISAKAQIEELSKQLADKQIDITEMQDEHTRDIRKQNLQNELDTYRQSVEDKKKTEDEKYKAEKTRLETERKDLEYHFNEIINDERKWAKIREEIIAGNIKNIETELQNSLKNLEGYNKDTVRALNQSYQTLLTNIASVKSALNSLGGIDYNNKPMNLENEILYLKNLYSTGTSGQKAWAKQQAQSYGIDISKYHDGGIVGDNGNVPDYINKWFNIKPGEQLTKSLIGELQVPPKNFPNFLANLGNVFSSLSTTTPSGSIYNLNLNIESVTGDKNGGQVVFKEIVDGLKKMGRR